jgi:rod shape-determining protein MreC
MLLFVTLIFFITHHLIIKAPGTIETVSSYFLYPVFIVQKKITTPFKIYFKNKREQQDLYQKYTELKNENESLESRITELEASKEFLASIDPLIRFKAKYDTDAAHLSQVIFKRISDKEHIFLVNNGSVHGIVKDMVAVYKNNLIGKVIDVYPYYSTVMLVTDKRCKVSVYCSWIKTKGILQGANSSEYITLTHVDRLKKLRKKELLLSTGDGTIFPQGFRLGTIESFEPEGVHYKVTVAPSFDPYDIEYCYLLQKGSLTQKT